MVVEKLFINALVDVEFIVLTTVVIVLKFALAVSYSTDVSSDVVVDLFMDAVTDIIRGFLINIGVVGMLEDVNVNMFVSAMIAFKFAMLDPLEGFRC